MGLVDWPLVARTAADALAKVGLSLPLHAPVATLGPGVRQLLAIARAVHGGARLLILDEPTSSLSLDDASRLADIVREIAARGTAVVYISHRIEDSVRWRNASSSCGTAASRLTRRSPRSRRPRSGRHCREVHPRSRRPEQRRARRFIRLLRNPRTCSSKSAVFARTTASAMCRSTCRPGRSSVSQDLSAQDARASCTPSLAPRKLTPAGCASGLETACAKSAACTRRSLPGWGSFPRTAGARAWCSATRSRTTSRSRSPKTPSRTGGCAFNGSSKWRRPPCSAFRSARGARGNR